MLFMSGPAVPAATDFFFRTPRPYPHGGAFLVPPENRKGDRHALVLVGVHRQVLGPGLVGDSLYRTHTPPAQDRADHPRGISRARFLLRSPPHPPGGAGVRAR